MDLEECVQVGNAAQAVSLAAMWKIGEKSGDFSPNQKLMWNPEWEEWLDLERKMFGMSFFPWFGFHGNSAVNKKYLIVRVTGLVRKKNPRFLRENPREKSYLAKNNGEFPLIWKTMRKIVNQR